MAVPDSCYDSSHDSLSYCWCSHADLCNAGPSLLQPLTAFHIYSLSVALSTYLLMWYNNTAINISYMKYSQVSISQYSVYPVCASFLSNSWSTVASPGAAMMTATETGSRKGRKKQNGHFTFTAAHGGGRSKNIWQLKLTTPKNYSNFFPLFSPNTSKK